MQVEDLIHRLDIVEENINSLFSDAIQENLKSEGLIREFKNLRISKVEFIQKQIPYIKNLFGNFNVKLLEGALKDNPILLEEKKPEARVISETGEELFVPVEEINIDINNQHKEKTSTTRLTTIKTEFERFKAESLNLKNAISEFLPKKGTSVEDILDIACRDIENNAKQMIRGEFESMREEYYRIRSELAVEEIKDFVDILDKCDKKNKQIKEICEDRLLSSLNGIFCKYGESVKLELKEILNLMHLNNDDIEKKIDKMTVKNEIEIPILKKIDCKSINEEKTTLALKAFLKAAVVDPTKLAIIGVGSFFAAYFLGGWFFKPDPLGYLALVVVLLAVIQIFLSVPKEMTSLIVGLRDKETSKLKVEPKDESSLLEQFEKYKKAVKKQIKRIVGQIISDYKSDSELLRSKIDELQKGIDDAIAPVDNVLKNVNVIIEK